MHGLRYLADGEIHSGNHSSLPRSLTHYASTSLRYNDALLNIFHFLTNILFTLIGALISLRTLLLCTNYFGASYLNMIISLNIPALGANIVIDASRCYEYLILIN
jgi:hypothetical protein